jgi:hypothetical protein
VRSRRPIGQGLPSVGRNRRFFLRTCRNPTARVEINPLRRRALFWTCGTRRTRAGTRPAFRSE